MSHEEHQSFIKTPKQLIAVVILSFVAFIGVAVLASQYVTTGQKGLPNEEVTATAIAPVAKVELATAKPANAGPRTGEQVFQAACAACHDTGAAGAPKVGDNAAWGPRIATGLEALLKSATNGKNAMPAKGGAADLSELELTRAIVFMANKSGASFKEPAAPAAAEGQAATVDGKAVYEASCAACHGTGAAGAPKFGDKAAWAPRIATGMDSLLKSATGGKNAMPAKGGNAALSDAEIKAAVEHMVAAGK